LNECSCDLSSCWEGEMLSVRFRYYRQAHPDLPDRDFGFRLVSRCDLRWVFLTYMPVVICPS
jgi:hypothetical protein